MCVSSNHVTMQDDEHPTPAFSTEIASSTATSISIRWAIRNDASMQDVIPHILGYRVHYQKVASSYVLYSHLLPPDVGSYSIDNLVADTYYKVCLVMYRNDTSIEDRECMDASTTSWHIPVSIGSSIGALLALTIIVLIVLLSRCPSLIKDQRPTASESSKYDSMTSSRYHDDHDYSDTTTHCHDHEDDVFYEHCVRGHVLESSRHGHHHYPSHHTLPDRLCNGNKNHVFLGMAGGAVPPKHAHHQHAQRAHSLGACGRSHSLERPRPHHSRRSQLMQLHSAHQSVQSEPAAPGSHHTIPRPLHVSISDLPPAVHISDPDAPVCSLVSGMDSASGEGVSAGGTRVKASLKDMPRTFHMSIDYDV